MLPYIYIYIPSSPLENMATLAYTGDAYLTDKGKIAYFERGSTGMMESLTRKRCEVHLVHIEQT